VSRPRPCRWSSDRNGAAKTRGHRRVGRRARPPRTARLGGRLRSDRPHGGEPVTAATRFQDASLSKPVAAWGVLRLVEQDRIGLDEPVVGHLRRWRPPREPFDADGVTVRRLLSHTGRPFAEFMQAEVVAPLGMTASSIRWRRTAATARPHDVVGGRVPDFAFAEQAAAGLVTTAPDLARFVAAALPGPHGEPRGVGWSARPGCGSPPPLPPKAAGGLGMALGCCPAATCLPTTRAPTAAGGPAWRCCPSGERASWCSPTAPRSTPWSSIGWRWRRRAVPPNHRRHRLVLVAVAERRRRPARRGRLRP
jgi:hypothetical protein